jgi:hypothetical protein
MAVAISPVRLADAEDHRQLAQADGLRGRQLGQQQQLADEDQHGDGAGRAEGHAPADQFAHEGAGRHACHRAQRDAGKDDGHGARRVLRRHQARADGAADGPEAAHAHAQQGAPQQDPAVEGASATSRFDATSSAVRASSTMRRSSRPEPMVTPMAANAATMPGVVIISPAWPLLMASSAAMAGSRPTGRNSDVTRAKAPMPTDSTASQGATVVSRCRWRPERRGKRVVFAW